MSDSLMRELRAVKPAAPAELRQRVRALAANAPARRPFLARLEWRRFALVGAPATVAVALAAATVIGLTRDDVGGRDQSASGAAAGSVDPRAYSTVPALTPGLPATALESAPRRTKAAPPAAADSSAAIAPDPTRVQRYGAELQLRVENVNELSRATQRAQRIASQLGGSVSSLSYDAPRGGIGSANIVLRIPIERVQTAMTQLSQLGTILGQRFGIEDLQPAVDDYSRRVERLQRRVASLNTQLARPDLTDSERAILRSRRAAAQQELTGLRRQLNATRAEGRYATVALTLTTERIEAVVPGGKSKLDGIRDVLVWEGIVALYALVVAGPIVLLGVLLWLALRLRRRREETRLLAQT
jgi:Domain of unknown function (DUF4349)